MEGHGHSPRKSSPDAPGSPAHVVTSSELSNISHELKTNCTIDPERSKYIQYWDVLIVIALVYTATITPYEIGFIHTDTEIDSMFVCCSGSTPGRLSIASASSSFSEHNC